MNARRGLVVWALLLGAVVTALGQHFSVSKTQLLWNPIFSRNVVGYIKAVVERGNYALVSNPFEPLSAPMTPANVFGDQLPVGTTLCFWDAASLKYNMEGFSSNKAAGLTWSPNTNLLIRGAAFWLKIPASAPSTSYTVFIFGEVPDAYTAPTTTVEIASGLNLIGYPYPANIVWSNAQLSKIANNGDALCTYGASGYMINGLFSNKAAGLAWSCPTQVIETGRGYWFRRNTASALSWTEIKPYSWP